MKKPWRPNKGAEGVYIQRARALRKLQVSLADFRRLCILKGVVPRVPKKKLQGRDKVYYYLKDITHLAHDPLLRTFRNQKASIKKVHKAIARHDVEQAKRIVNRQEKPDLAPVLRDRYPSLMHALNDMDDALSCLALFASLPVDNESNILGQTIEECRSLMDHWDALVAREGLLEKVFASIKGYYFQVVVLGARITWVVPHQLPTHKAHDVDLRVMSTFLELYRALVKFVLFKLYKIQGYAYPPSYHTSKHLSDGRWLNIKLERIAPLEAEKVVDDEEAEQKKSRISSLKSDDPTSQQRRSLFNDQIFYICRETPIAHIALCVTACGCKLLGFDELTSLKKKPLSQVKRDDQKVTHYVVDRPLNAIASFPNQLTASFIQPQWIFDSLNVGALLPTNPYKCGNTPPPHLSPFVDDEAEGYVPEQRRVLDEWTGRKQEQPVECKVPIEVRELEHEEIEAITEAHQTQIAGEQSTEDPKTTPQDPLEDKLAKIVTKRKQKESTEERVRGKMALTRKKRKLLTQMEARMKEQAKKIPSR